MRLQLFFLLFLTNLLFIVPLSARERLLPPEQSSPDSLLFKPLPIHSSLTETFHVEHPLEWEYVHHSNKIAFLLKVHREIADNQRGMPGFRVHLFMDSGNRARLNALQEQVKFEENFPDMPAYIIYEEPYFKLRAGDFRTRLDARRFLETIRRQYSGAYIVVDRINYPPLD